MRWPHADRLSQAPARRSATRCAPTSSNTPRSIEEAINKLQEKRQVAADTQLRQNLAQNRKAMEQDARDFVTGNPNGKITVVEFFDYRCPYCKAALPEIEQASRRQQGRAAGAEGIPDPVARLRDAAARAAIGAKAQGKYWPVHMALMNAKQTSTTPRSSKS